MTPFKARKKVELEPDDHRLWNKSQVQCYVNQLLGAVGIAWAWMTPRVRRALVAEEALAIVRHLDRGEMRVASIDCLYKDMIAMAPIDLPGED